MKNTASRCRGYFYPRSPCGERRLSYFYIIKITQFLSTLSLRRATIPDREPAAGYLISIHALLAESDPTRWAPTCRISNFYPRSPCGERPDETGGMNHAQEISIHALLAESDSSTAATIKQREEFLSTLSLRRATMRRPPQESAGTISIHALLAESDRAAMSTDAKRADFYPRSPCGERPIRPAPALPPQRFLSTLSLRRATRPGQ